MPVFTPSERIGRRLEGKYAIERILAQGGMGVVFEGTHVGIGRKVAIKLLKSDSLEPGDQARLSLEARAATRLNHPNVVQVLDIGVSEDGVAYLVMELLSGRTLKEELLARGTLAPAEALAWLLPVLGAVAHAHDHGIVHRDLKPANVLLSVDASGRVVPKLLDFGIAKVIEETGMTSPGTMLGTPHYLAPEQVLAVDDQPVGPEADQWALGVTLYQCLSGRLPFEAAQPAAIFHKIANDLAPPLHGRAPHLPVALAAAVDRSLRKDPSARYADVRELARALLHTARNAGVELPDDPDPIGLPEWSRWTQEVQDAGDSTLEQPRGRGLASAVSSATEAPSRGPRGVLWVLALGLVAALLYLLSRDGEKVVPRAEERPVQVALPPSTPAPVAALAETETAAPDDAASEAAQAPATASDEADAQRRAEAEGTAQVTAPASARVLPEVRPGPRRKKSVRSSGETDGSPSRVENAAPERKLIVDW